MKFLLTFWICLYAYAAHKLWVDGWQFFPIITGSFGIASIGTAVIGLPILIVGTVVKLWKKRK